MTEKNSSSFYVPFVAIIVLIATFVAFQFSPFTKGLWWYDIPLHFLGGVWIAFLFRYLFEIKTNLFDHKNNFFFALLITTSFVALIGVFWEFWEFWIDKTIAPTIYLNVDPLTDTLKDLLMDVLGGTIATVYLWKIK